MAEPILKVKTRLLVKKNKGAAMFKIIAVVLIGILSVIGFFDLGTDAYMLALLLLVIATAVDYGFKSS